MVEMTDTTGEEDYSALREQWIHDGQGFLVVYSITSRYSFEAAQRLYKQVQEIKGPSNPPVILVGNKFDESSTAREVSIAEGAALADELGCEFMEASAKVDINVHLAFANIVRALRRGAMEDRQRQLEIEKARLERIRAEIELRKREERAARKSGGEVIHDENGMPRNKNAFSRFIGKLKG
jgi:GTPase KRas